MTRITPLLDRNEQFAAVYTPAPLGPPAAQLLILACLDHRAAPAAILGLQLGDAIVIRNTGGLVTEAVIDDIAYLTYLAGQLFGEQAFAASGFEVAVVQHTQCGAGFLADPGFRRQAAAATGIPEATLEASAVADPHTTVKADVERLLASPLLHPAVSVSGHVTTSPPDASPPPWTPGTRSRSAGKFAGARQPLPPTPRSRELLSCTRTGS